MLEVAEQMAETDPWAVVLPAVIAAISAVVAVIALIWQITLFRLNGPVVRASLAFKVHSEPKRGVGAPSGSMRATCTPETLDSYVNSRPDFYHTVFVQITATNSGRLPTDVERLSIEVKRNHGFSSQSSDQSPFPRRLDARSSLKSEELLSEVRARASAAKGGKTFRGVVELPGGKAKRSRRMKIPPLNPNYA